MPPTRPTITPRTIGVLGGGQLGMMLAREARSLPHTFRFFDPAQDACAAPFGEHICAPWDDTDALDRFADGLDLSTIEFESVPPDAAQRVASRCVLRPGTASLATTRDRITERSMIDNAGLSAPTWKPIRRDSLDTDIITALEAVGEQGVLKAATGGYDGKGQSIIRSASDLANTARALNADTFVYESLIPFRRELSLVGARWQGKQATFYPPAENIHVEGMLSVTRAPALDVQRRALESVRAGITRVLDQLDHVGAFCFELFDLEGELLVNEIAPRVHNSGHWTLLAERADVTSQFSLHLAAITDSPPGPTAPSIHAGMINVIGVPPDPGAIDSIPSATLDLYGKQPKPKRKLGHINVSADSPEERDELIRRVLRALPPDALHADPSSIT